jgi:hypothetical protein
LVVEVGVAVAVRVTVADRVGEGVPVRVRVTDKVGVAVEVGEALGVGGGVKDIVGA